MLSIDLMTEERTAASASGALALGRTATAPQHSARTTAYGTGDVCALDVRGAHTFIPVTKAWDVRPLDPVGGGGG